MSWPASSVYGLRQRENCRPQARQSGELRPGHHGARAELAKPLAERLFFAGEAVATPYVTLCHGAYQSGQDVARKVAATIA